MKRYNVGDQVWWARCGTRQVTKTCPVCFGKLTVCLILGDESKVVLPCDYCGKGYEGPRGTIEEYEYLAEAEQVTIPEVKVSETQTGETREYRFRNSCPNQTDLFDARDEALLKCAETVAQKMLDESTRVESLKKYLNKNYSWNAGYHIRNAEKCERDAHYHREKAVLCKARAKEPHEKS